MAVEVPRFTNNAKSVLATAVADTDLTLSVAPGDGVKFPSLAANEIFRATLVNAAKNYEIIKVTQRVDDTFTIVRGQEGTTPLAFSAGDIVALRPTAQAFEELFVNNLIQAAEGVLGRIALATQQDVIDGVATDTAVTPATMRGFINSLLYSTGDIKPTLKTVADTGWVIANDGTIGKATSGASTRANDDTYDLFVLIWSNTSEQWCPVSGGKGTTADNDWFAGKTIALPKMKGRSVAGYGGGTGLTFRELAENLGEEVHELLPEEIPSHDHEAYHAQYSPLGGARGDAHNTINWQIGSEIANTYLSRTGFTFGDLYQNTTPHNVMQPTVFVNWMIKL